MRVLVVDDDVKILRFIRSSLTLAGYEVVTATSGEEALKATGVREARYYAAGHTDAGNGWL